MASRFMKPNNDRIFYLFSDKATKTNVGAKTYEYRWDIPDINVNEYGKLYLINRIYKTMDVTATPIVTRLLNFSSKDNVDTFRTNGEILDISSWANDVASNPPIIISPQTINSFIISLNDDMALANNGSTTTNVFVLILKLTEEDRDIIKFGSTNDVNINQRLIPTYN